MNLQPQNPIGIFDSGIGGLTVANGISKVLPNEQLIYFGDTAHLPYGDKSPEAIQQYAVKISDFLLEKKCKLIIIACNTASSAAYDTLKKHLKGKALLMNMIDPAVDYIVNTLKIKNLGIIGTKGTIKANVYEKKLKELDHEMEISSLATPLLAPMIEEGFFNNNISKTIIQTYLSSIITDIEALLLACTHYPLIREEIKEYFDEVTVIDSPDIIAQCTLKLLQKHKLLNKQNNNAHHFYVSDYTDAFKKTTSLFYKKDVRLLHYPIWEI